MTLAVVLALATAALFGLGLVLTQVGLRGLTPVAGAAISIPSSTLLFLALAPFILDTGGWSWPAVAIFAGVGLLYPATATLITFEANRALGPVITGTLGNLAPLFAVSIAVTVLGEPLRPLQGAGLAAVIAGIVVLTWPHSGRPARWRSWLLLLPLAAAAIRGIIQPTVKLGLAEWPSPFAAALIGYIVSTLVVLTSARLRTGRFVAPAPRKARLTFVGVGLCNSLGALMLYGALAHGPVSLVSPLVATYPLATVALGALILGKSDGGPRLAFAVALTVLGVGLLIAG